MTRLILSVLLSSLVLTGCGNQESPITVYEIAKTESGLDDLTPISGDRKPAPPQANLPDSRMVVGLALRPDATWTFKILGLREAIDGSESEWREFFTKLKFDATGLPVFEVPEKWVDRGVRQGMFSTVRTLLIDEKTNSKMEISSLSAGQGIEMNVNRWRGQLGLERLEGKIELPKVSYEGGELLLFDEVGKFGGRGGPMSGMMPGQKPNVPSTPTKSATSSNPTVQFTAPEGWESGKTSSIILGRFKKNAEGKEVELTIARLPAINEWQLNASTWASSIGLKGVDETKIDGQTELIEVDGVAGRKIEFTNSQNKRGLLGIMFKKHNSAWLAKLMGDLELVESSETEFDKFWKSLRTNAATDE